MVYFNRLGPYPKLSWMIIKTRGWLKRKKYCKGKFFLNNVYQKKIEKGE